MRLRGGRRQDGAAPETGDGSPAAPANGADGVLMRRVAAGGHAAFQTLVDRHLGRVLALAQRITGNPSDADDVAQEAFLRVWQHAGRFDPDRARFTTWLYRIVVNLCLDRKRRPQHDPIALAETVEDDAEDAVHRLAREQDSAALLRALERLPDRQRTALVLYYFEELGSHEAAEILGIRGAAFDSLLLRARRALRRELAPLRRET